MILLVAIILSLTVAMPDTVSMTRERYGTLPHGIEWFHTPLFSIEYAFRFSCVLHPLRYATSFQGVVDLRSRQAVRASRSFC